MRRYYPNVMLSFFEINGSCLANWWPGFISFIFSDTKPLSVSGTFFSIRDEPMRWMTLLTLAAFFTPRCSAITAWDFSTANL